MKNFIILLLCTCVSIASLSQNIVQGEYFIDTDLGFGNNTLVNFTPAADGAFQLSVTVSSYPPGYHKLYFRTKDSDGKWSLTSGRNIEVLASEAKTSIVKGEYFIDTDPGFGMGMPITITSPDSILLQNFSAVATGLSEGYHKLYGRFEDNLGRWSLTLRRNIEVFKSDTNKVLNGEYFFKTDLGFGSCDAVSFAVPTTDGSFLINIARNTIPADADTLFLRVRDDIENRWSITQILGNISGALPLTLLNFIVTNQDAVAQLTWQTANEINTSHFNIQRSTDGVSFTTVGKVNANLNPGLQNNYTYRDDIAEMKPGKVYYRLQMIDNDGQFNYSKIVYITIDGSSLPISIYPNPAHNYFIISNYGRADIKNAIVLVRDMSGRTLISQKFNNSAEERVNISMLSKGTYIINMVTNSNVQTHKLIIE
jgi:hypothetical protein